MEFPWELLECVFHCHQRCYCRFYGDRVQAMSYDAMVPVVGCDKNMPGALVAMLRVNRPSIVLGEQ